MNGLTAKRGLAGAAGFALGVAGGMLLDRDAGVSLVCGIFGAIMTVAAAIDLQERRIPNRLTYPGVVVALALAMAYGRSTLVDAVLGTAFAGGVMLLFFVLARGGLGLGDVKFSAMVGAVIGVAQVPTYLLIASGLGAIAGVTLLAMGRDRRAGIAYGPFLSVGGLVVLLTAGPVVL